MDTATSSSSTLGLEERRTDVIMLSGLRCDDRLIEISSVLGRDTQNGVRVVAVEDGGTLVEIRRHLAEERWVGVSLRPFSKRQTARAASASTGE